MARATRTDPQQERAWLIDNATGGRIGNVEVGTRTSVPLKHLLDALDRCPGCVAVFAHTHPDDVPFSDQDVAVLLKRVEVLAVVVVTARSWYVIRADASARKPTITALTTVYSEEYAKVEVDIEEDTRLIGKPAALHRHGHVLWTAAATRLQLRYQRIEEGGTGDDREHDTS